MKSRHLSSEIKKKSQSKFGRIIVLTGARQTGKTTLSKHLFSDYSYVSIEDPITAIALKELTAQAFYKNYKTAILDEIQKVPSLVETVKSVYDQYDDARYILLGSSQILLLEKIKESLAGRCSIYELYPLTIPELINENENELIEHSNFQTLLKSQSYPELIDDFRIHDKYADIQYAYEHYLSFGGYPAISDPELSDEERYDWLLNYTRTYLERDIRDLIDFKYLEPFVKLQKITALLTAQPVNASALAKEAQISAPTVRRYLTYLDISYQVIQLQAWYRNPLKRLVKSPKIHYLDPGVLRTIVGKRGPLNGHEFESAIVAEMFKQFKYAKIPGAMYHLRTNDGREVDALIEVENGYYAFEIKLNSHVQDSDARNLRGLDEILDKPLLHGFILSNDPKTRIFDNNVTAVHAGYFLS